MDIVLPYDLYHLLNMIVMDISYTGHGFNIIDLPKLQKRKIAWLVIHKTIDWILPIALLSIFTLIFQENASVIRL